MWCRCSIVAAATFILSAPPAIAAELPAFERNGFPITPHQVAVMGAQDVHEQSASPTLTFGGMPASPHQIAVVTPRPEMTTTAAKPTTVGLVAQ